jgi:hypothetical protein
MSPAQSLADKLGNETAAAPNAAAPAIICRRSITSSPNNYGGVYAALRLSVHRTAARSRRAYNLTSLKRRGEADLAALIGAMSTDNAVHG